MRHREEEKEFLTNEDYDMLVMNGIIRIYQNKIDSMIKNSVDTFLSDKSKNGEELRAELNILKKVRNIFDTLKEKEYDK